MRKLDSHEIENHPDIDGIIDGLYDQDITKVASRMGNVLEKVTIEEYPVIEQIKNVIEGAGGTECDDERKWSNGIRPL